MSDYQIAHRNDTQQLARFLAKEGQFLLPLVSLIEEAEMAVDELIDVAGRATLEAVLTLSAQQVAGGKHPGKGAGPIRWHGRQAGVVCLSERKLRVEKPRLRRKPGGSGSEVPVPAYEAMQSDSRLARRMLEILMLGISTRRYQDVLPEMAETVGVSKSSVSREFVEASAEVLQKLAERRFDDRDLLVIYLDGLVFGAHHVLAAVGVDAEGNKQVLGLREGASENAVVAKALLEELVQRGVKPGRKRLFVIDGSSALRLAIEAVYGSDNPVQRCRNHKRRNVLGHLPKELHDQANAVLKAAWRLEAPQGMAKLEQLAEWLERDHPSAAASLREGLEEMFTINRLGLPATLRRCFGSTNLIDSSHSGMRQKTRRVTHWQDGSMVLRWAASALMATEKKFRRIMGYKQLWILKAYLDEDHLDQKVTEGKQAG